MSDELQNTESELHHGLFNLTLTLLQTKMQRMGFDQARKETKETLESLINTIDVTNEDTMKADNNEQ